MIQDQARAVRRFFYSMPQADLPIVQATPKMDSGLSVIPSRRGGFFALILWASSCADPAGNGAIGRGG